MVVLDLHWTSSTGVLASGQDLFLSKDSIRFWASVAGHPALRDRAGVVFELFNEPHDDGSAATISPTCYLDGDGCPPANPGFAGYNQAVHAIRVAANATNMLLFAGKNWNFDLEWLLVSVLHTTPMFTLGNAWRFAHPGSDTGCCSAIVHSSTRCQPGI